WTRWAALLLSPRVRVQAPSAAWIAKAARPRRRAGTAMGKRAGPWGMIRAAYRAAGAGVKPAGAGQGRSRLAGMVAWGMAAQRPLLDVSDPKGFWARQ